MPISDLAQRLLNAHAKEPNKIYYADEVLGGMFRESDLEQLDAAYRELEDAGLMQKASVTISYFGMPKGLLRITKKGSRKAKSTAA
jgi:hypothetical protein